MNATKLLAKYEKLAEAAHKTGAYACARKWSIKVEKLEAVISVLEQIEVGMDFETFKQKAIEAGTKPDGGFSAKKQRDEFLRKYYPLAATEQIQETYVYACLNKLLQPSEQDLRLFHRKEINQLISMGVIDSSHQKRAPDHGFYPNWMKLLDKEDSEG